MSKRRPTSRAPRLNYVDMLSDDDSVGSVEEAIKKHRRSDDEYVESDDDDVKQKKRKRVAASEASKKLKASSKDRERDRERERGRDSKKPASKSSSSSSSSKPARKRKAREEIWDGSSDDFESVRKTAVRVNGAQKTTTKVAPDADAARAKARAKKGRAVDAESIETMPHVSGELEALRKKSAALRQFRETETDRLLGDARSLALEEKKTYEKLIAKLKKNIVELSTRVEQAESKKHHREHAMRTEHDLCHEKLEREQKGRQRDHDKLQKRIQELETQLAQQAAESKGQRQVAEIADAADAQTRESVELVQAKKLIGAYRLVTSIELRLIEGLDDEDTGAESYTDLACAVVDSATGKRFQFDLAIPADDTEEIEFVPSDPPSTDFPVPSYLKDELSFKKSELTKFMRTLLDMTIKKKGDEEGPTPI